MKWCWFRQLQCLNLHVHPTSDITSDNYSYLKFNEKYFHCLEEVLLEVLWGNCDNFFLSGTVCLFRQLTTVGEVPTLASDNYSCLKFME